MVDRLGYDKNFRTVFVGKISFYIKEICKLQNFVKIVIWHTILLSKFESLACKTTSFFPSLKHCNIFVQFLSVLGWLLASGSETATVFYDSEIWSKSVGCKIVDLRSRMRSLYPGTWGFGDMRSRFLNIRDMFVNARGNIDLFWATAVKTRWVKII